jgi:hypothetical protein
VGSLYPDLFGVNDWFKLQRVTVRGTPSKINFLDVAERDLVDEIWSGDGLGPICTRYSWYVAVHAACDPHVVTETWEAACFTCH